MSTPVITRPTLREVMADALEDAFWARRAEIEGCTHCTRNPTGICGDHQEDNNRAREYEDARKQLERNPEHPEVLAVLAGIEAAALVSGTEGGE